MSKEESVQFRLRLGDDNVTRKFKITSSIGSIYKSLDNDVMNPSTEYLLFIPSLRQKLDRVKHKSETLESIGITFDVVIMVQCDTQKRFMVKTPKISKAIQQQSFLGIMDDHSKNKWGHRLDGGIVSPPEFIPPSKEKLEEDIRQSYIRTRMNPQITMSKLQGEQKRDKKRKGIHTMSDL